MPIRKVGNVINWASIIDEATMEQAQTSARMPFLAGPIALMPDAHLGKGATIGSVIATRGAVMPAAVGVDIGCGMIAAPLGLTSDALPDDLDTLHGLIAEVVPAGMGKSHEHDRRVTAAGDIFTTGRMPDAVHESNDLKRRATSQFGTLGGGNHFVELSLDEDDNVWLVLHSGSRGVGNILANMHIKAAKKLMDQMFIELEDADLAYLVGGTAEFDSYIHDMRWAQDYAYRNRRQMFDAIVGILRSFGLPVDHGEPINCHHNYCTKENHHGQNCWITRKGAISARSGEYGIIPGSMGTDTYIVRGLGNPSSYHSASHGAGRVMSRSKARKQLTVESLRDAMGNRAWNETQANAVLDEHPSAYKPIETVMRDQSDLVEPIKRLEQVVSYKGTN